MISRNSKSVLLRWLHAVNVVHGRLQSWKASCHRHSSSLSCRHRTTVISWLRWTLSKTSCRSRRLKMIARKWSPLSLSRWIVNKETAMQVGWWKMMMMLTLIKSQMQPAWLSTLSLLLNLSWQQVLFLLSLAVFRISGESSECYWENMSNSTTLDLYFVWYLVVLLHISVGWFFWRRNLHSSRGVILFLDSVFLHAPDNVCGSKKLT